ncbi:MAG: DUF2958 domain-containing protein [Acidobacteria bacterium]|nr:DUF2958 domain-containing protein [Acidobacteriota bacterium]HMQ04392.1 DUF2958 domain-containing protein [Pyrinomonadaceae bacterium]
MSRLLDGVLRNGLPKLREQSDSKDPTVFAKFFFPASGWTWFVTEGEETGDDFLFFGYVIGFEPEWGYFLLSELESVEISGVRIERDIYFEQKPFSSCSL